MIVMLMSNIRLWQGRTAESIERSREARQLFVEMNDVLGQFRAMIPEARALAAAGRAEEAVATVDAAIEVAGGRPEASLVGILPSIAGQLGDLALAARARAELTSLEESLVSSPPDKTPPDELIVHFALLDLQSGQPAAALDRLVTGELPSVETLSSFAATVLALTLVAAGRAAEAVPLLDPVLADGSRATYADRIDALIARGMAVAALGQRRPADADFTSAGELADATDDVLRQRLTRLAAAHASGDASAITDARSRLCESGVAAEGWDTAYSLASSGLAASL
jgi:tetratricopeptide (TPR) repeat protein